MVVKHGVISSRQGYYNTTACYKNDNDKGDDNEEQDWADDGVSVR